VYIFYSNQLSEYEMLDIFNTFRHLIKLDSKNFGFALLLCFENGYETLAQSLLEQNVTDMKTSFFNNALVTLISLNADIFQEKTSKFNLLKLFVEKFNITTMPETFFLICVQHSELKILKYLLEIQKTRFDVNQRDMNGNSLIMCAIMGHNDGIEESQILQTINYLVQNHNADLQVTNFRGTSSVFLSLTYKLNTVLNFIFDHNRQKRLHSQFLPNQAFSANKTIITDCENKS
jgi:hypothetical protein